MRFLGMNKLNYLINYDEIIKNPNKSADNDEILF